MNGAVFVAACWLAPPSKCQPPNSHASTENERFWTVRTLRLPGPYTAQRAQRAVLDGAHVALCRVPEVAVVDERFGAFGGERAAHARGEVPLPRPLILQRVEVQKAKIVVAVGRSREVKEKALLRVRLVDAQPRIRGADAIGLGGLPQ